MDFAFIGGSMGAVVGEKISRGINHSIKTKSHNDFKIRWSKNDGSGLFFDAISKTSVKLAQLAEEKYYISLCRDPTTGGTTASYAMLGDINISEPGALIGSQDQRVVRDTT
jgi:acetyl-CoA carboxylase carboxyl transferase subunit beta